MILEQTDVKITRYRYGDYFLDIVDNGDVMGTETKEAWLSHKDYGISAMMIGLDAESRVNFLQACEEMLPEFIEIYRKEYEDD